MNLIQQLQETPKWKEFEEWYNKQEYTLELYSFDYYGRWMMGFNELEISFQKGVFEKFIESQGYQLEQNSDGNIMKYTIWTSENGFEYQENLEELLIWYFNN